MAMHYEYWNWAAVTRRLGDLWLLARSMSRNGSEEKVLFLRREKKVTLCVIVCFVHYEDWNWVAVTHTGGDLRLLSPSVSCNEK